MQLGLVLNGNVVEDLSIGGPAFNSCLLKTGDIICKVNGQVAIENLLPPHSDGMQAAGSHVVLTILSTAVLCEIYNFVLILSINTLFLTQFRRMLMHRPILMSIWLTLKRAR